MGAAVVGAWHLLAAVTTTTTTTTSTTSTTGVTTTTLVQAAGSQGDAVNDVWVPLLAAVVGAIVGGCLSLAGSVWVNRMEVSRAARLRIYDELLPRLRSDLYSFVEGIEADKRTMLEEEIKVLVRVSFIAGRPEHRYAASVEKVWSQNWRVMHELTRQDHFLLEEGRRKQIEVPAHAATKEIRSNLDALERVLKQRLERRFGWA